MFDRLGRKDQRKPGPFGTLIPIAASFQFAGCGHIMRFFETQYRFEA